MKKDTWLIAFVLFAGIVFLMPNGIEARDQRTTGFTLAMLIAAGVYVFSRVDTLLGALILYVAFISGITAYRDPQLYYMLFSLIIFLIWITRTRTIDKELLYDALIVFACVNLTFQILQVFKIHFVIVSHTQTPGFMSHINETSALYAMSAPAFFRKKRWYFLPIIIAGLIMSRSFQGVVTFGIVSALWFFLNQGIKRGIVMSVVIALLVVCFGTFVKSFEYQNYKTKRMYLWQQTAKATLVKPLFGWGFDQYRFVMPLITSWGYLKPEERAGIYNQILDRKAFEKAANIISAKDTAYFKSDRQLNELHIQAHNEFIEWFFIGGIVGAVLMFVLLIRILFMSFFQEDKIPFYGFLSAIIVCMFGFSWHLMPLALITVLYIALIEREDNKVCLNFYPNSALGLQG